METKQITNPTHNTTLTHTLQSQWIVFPLQQELPALPREAHQASTPHWALVSTADQADAEGTHTAAHRHPKTPTHQAQGTTAISCWSGNWSQHHQTGWCRTVSLPLLSIWTHLFGSFNTFCHWEVLHCWCLQPAFEMLQKESLELWECIFFFPQEFT